jgi:hypothetical protein
MTKPSLGRIVLYSVDPARNASLPVAPAMITRVWSDDEVDLMIFPVTGQPYAATSIKLHAREPEPAKLTIHQAWWPPRV